MGKLAACSLCIFISNISLASAWLQEPGKSELISKYEYKIFIPSNENFFNTGAKVFSLEIYDLFYQYGFNNKLTIGFETKGYNYHNNSPNIFNNYLLLEQEDPFISYNEYQNYENAPLETKFFVQTKLWNSDRSIISIQPSILFCSKYLDKKLELRSLYGYNFKLGKEYSYINIELAANRRTHQFISADINSTTLKLDLTFGLALNKQDTIMFQSFYYHNHSLYQNYYHTGQISWLYNYNKHLTLQTGYATNFTNRDQYIANSVIIGLWLRF